MTDTDMLYMASLEKRNEELEAKVAELEGKHWNECRQIAHYDDELRRAKELLKKAVEDFKTLGIELDSNCELCGFRLGCEECPLHRAGINCRCWNKRDEALALLGKDIDVPAAATDINVGGKIDSWISCEDRLGKAAQDCKSCARLPECNAYKDGDSFENCEYKWVYADEVEGC